MIRNGVTTALVVLAVFASCNLPVSTADKLCYACNSYMSQCQHPALQAGTTNVFQARCNGKCFTRQGEDDAIYRGCFDAFKAVKQLTENYVGCRNQTWNNRVRRWCLCDTDLCNIHAIDDTVKYSQHVTSYSQTSSSTASQGTSSYSGSAAVHLITPQQPQHQHQQPQQQQPPVHQAHHHYYDVVQTLKQAVGNSDVVNNNNNNNTLEKTPSSVGDKNTDFNSVWNSWHVDLSNVNRPPSSLQSSVSLPAPHIQLSAAQATGAGPVESYSGGGGVLHSIHNHQQPTKSYAGTEVFRIRQHPVRAPVSSLPQLAKSNDFHSDLHEGVEPIENADSDSGNYTLSSAAASNTDADARNDRYERMLQNQDSSAAAADSGHAKLSELTESDNSTAVTSEEDLEYPYNQNIHHPIEWSPVEYVEQPPAVLSESESLASETATPESSADAVANIEYPYNQERQPYNDLVTDNNNYADYGPAVLKEAPENGEEIEESEQPELMEKALDYPYNQLLVPDIFGNPTSMVHDKKKGSAAVNDKTIHDTVHSPHHQSILEEHHHQQQQQQLENATSHSHRQVVVRQELPPHHVHAPTGSNGIQEVYHRSVHSVPQSDGAPAQVGDEMVQLKTKDKYAMSSVDAALTSRHQRPISSRHGSEPRVEAKEGDDGLYYENMGNLNSHSTQQIVPQIRCSHTGYYQNPKDCTQFVACLFDHNTRTKVLHLMRCPSGLVWDNFHKLCMETSSTCREELSQATLDNNYFQFFADVNGASTPSGSDTNEHQLAETDAGLLKDIKHKLDDIKQF